MSGFARPLSPLANDLKTEATDDLSFEAIDQTEGLHGESPEEIPFNRLRDQLDTEIADHLLEAVQSHLVDSSDGRGLLVEASLGFSALFSSATPPALALFSYSSESFKDNESLPQRQEDMKVVEIHSFEPFDEVYETTKASIEREGFFKAEKDIVFVIGGPGSGKGTVCARLAKEFELTHLSTGDLLRAEVAAGTEIGRLCNQLMRDGQIVPMSVVIELLQVTIASDSESRGFLIDGFPRAVDQAVEFERAIRPAASILNFSCPLDVLESRLLERGKTSGRADDNLETIHKRFDTFQRESMPVLGMFGDRLLTVDGSRSVEEVYHKAKCAVEREGLFQPKKSVIFAISDGFCPEECHEICLRLTNDYNLNLLSFGGVHEFEEHPVVDPVSSDSGEIEHVLVTQDLPPRESLSETMSDLDGELAEHLMEAVQAQIRENANSETPKSGLIVEASFGFSPLFSEVAESEKTALALFSYPADSFQEGSLPSFTEAMSVLEITKFEPFEQVYAAVAESLVAEGIVKSAAGGSADSFNVVFAISDGSNQHDAHLLCERLAVDFNLDVLTFGSSSTLEKEAEVVARGGESSTDMDSLHVRMETLGAHIEVLVEEEEVEEEEAEAQVEPASTTRGEKVAAEVMHFYAKQRDPLTSSDLSASAQEEEIEILMQELASNIATIDESEVAQDLAAARIQALENSLEETKSDISRTAEDVADGIMGLMDRQAVLMAEKVADAEAIRGLEERVAVVAGEAAEEIQALLVENGALKGELERVKGDHLVAVETHARDIGEVRGGLNDALGKSLEMGQSYEKVLRERDSLDAQVSGLQLELQKEHTDRFDERVAFDNERSDLLARIATLESTVGETTSKRDSLNLDHQNLAKRHQDLWNLHKSTHAQHVKDSTAAENQLQRLQSELNAVISQRAEASMAVAELQEDLKDAKHHISELNDVVHMMKTHIARLSEQTRKSRVAVLEDHVGKLERVIASLQAELQFLRSLMKK
ncbi:hypothetical protein HDU98_007379 [Podochytrium sp. JEL0797]|nr:hypothetical protein HDU98_007379 [Podochytrium sp. JEL0797]